MGELDLEASVVVDAFDDALAVVSDAGDILDYNTAFADVVAPGDGADLDSIEAALDSCPVLRGQLERLEEGIVPIEADDDRRYYELTISDLDAGSEGNSTLAILHDVTAQQRQRNELARQNEQLDKFASFITHDLRNPLDVAIGRTTVVGELVDDPQVETHVEEIRASHSRMARIIQDVLTLARQGESIDAKSDVNLGETAEDAWNQVETDGAVLDVQTDQMVRADRHRLEQVFENLFRNSVEHSSTNNRTQSDDSVEHSSTDSRPQADDSVEHSSATESEPVTVTVGALDDGTGFHVSDNGPGIDDEARGQVLEAEFSDEDGTGLGLAIVSNIAEAHGWDVTVTTTSDGGARFEFSGVDVVDTAYRRS